MTKEPAQAAQLASAPLKSEAEWYQPIAELGVRGATVQPKGLVLIVGPNSSGKTQFLRDIYAILIGDQRSPVVCERLSVKKPRQVNEFIDSLVDRGQLKRQTRDGFDEVFRSAPSVGPFQDGVEPVRVQNLSSWYRDITVDPFATHDPRSRSFFRLVGHALVTGLFLDRRLIAANEVSYLDYEKSQPQNEMQALYLNTKARHALGQEAKNVFGRGVWLDGTRGNVLCLRVSQSATIPSADDRLEPEIMKQFRTIESEGDGMRSYIGIAMALLVGLNPTCLIDEPELCLHPPQAYQMGLFIGRHGVDKRHAIFVSTHSSHVLRGVIEATRDVQILRLTKHADGFRGHLIGTEVLNDCLARPASRAEAILDGIFADGVVVVESDGDRVVYQSAWEMLTKARAHKDLLFVPVGGIGGSSVATFYHRLKIPIAFIADLDFITNVDVMKDRLNVLSDPATAEAIIARCNAVVNALRELPPSISPEQIRDRVHTLVDADIQPVSKPGVQDDYKRIARELRAIASDINRSGPLKAGVKALEAHKSIHKDVQWIVGACEKVGIFLVPCGVLENWQPDGVKDAPSKKTRKSDWANWASGQIQSSPSMWQKILDFMAQVEAFQLLERHSIVLPASPNADAPKPVAAK